MPGKKKLLVGTRDSTLARLQTDLAVKRLQAKFPELDFEITAVKTKGDKVLNKPIAELGERGVFVKELEESLLANQVDFVVHSLKDLPTEMPDQLQLASTFERADCRDVFLSRTGLSFEDLPAGSRLATSSRRRVAQLACLRADLKFVDIRGNIQTRLRKLDEGDCDAMVLAAAGLLRLGLEARIKEFFEPSKILPAAGQGALAIECRKNRKDILDLLEEINDKQVWYCIEAERALLAKLGGGCSVPVGVLAQVKEGAKLEVQACVAALDGQKIVRASIAGEQTEARSLGERLACEILAAGASEILQELIEAPASVSPP